MPRKPGTKSGGKKPKQEAMTAADHHKMARMHHAKARLHGAKAELLEAKEPPKKGAAPGYY